MRKLFVSTLVILTVLVFTSCSGKKAESIDASITENTLSSGTTDSNYVELSKINEKLWVHTTYSNYNGSRTPSNGMVVITSEGFVLIDTPWNNEQTKELLKLTKEKFKKDFVSAIITHSHEDRMGGIETLLNNKIKVLSTSQTAQLAEKSGFKKPAPELDNNKKLKYGSTTLEILYPGEGHTVDNITVWFPDYKLLFGGCLIKSSDSKDIGNTSDANLAQWPSSVKKVKESYPDVKTVIPGHGKWGGAELLDHTLDLLSAQKK